ncbi:lipoprotein [Staphylococcus aureus]|uniref:lipoprotein n=1 Tax=Staphylococcus aureus TaxID=1280 RepID=UPI0002C90B18|nr:lipoprotein [Staphylococcus aureus]ENK86405.1 lipoprotein [Staphylococcus aureus M0628]
MKRLVTGLLALSLFLAACGQDSDQQKDSNKEKDDKAKTEKQDKKTNDSSKDKKDNKDDSKDVNKDNKDNSANDNQQQSNSNTTNNDQNQTNNNQSSNNQKSSYVAPYYGQNAAPVARQIYPFNGNKTQALQQLPNFQTALNAANNEANKFGSNNKVYNDYSIEEHNGNYKYVFSFKDPNANGKYSIVTVDYTGQAMVTDPNYQQ